MTSLFCSVKCFMAWKDTNFIPGYHTGAINATAHRIKVKSIKPPKPPALRDFMPPGVGSTLYETDNQYEQELLTGIFIFVWGIIGVFCFFFSLSLLVPLSASLSGW